MNKENVNQVPQDLIAKGLVEEYIENEEVKYRLTPLGRWFGDHMKSVSSVRN